MPNPAYIAEEIQACVLVGIPPVGAAQEGLLFKWKLVPGLVVPIPTSPAEVDAQAFGCRQYEFLFLF
jgi:hypothetical protein